MYIKIHMLEVWVQELRVKHWFKCPICLNYLNEYKNRLFFHIENFIKDEMLSSDVVEQHHQLSRFLEATMCDL
jgi:hypothetical protein